MLNPLGLTRTIVVYGNAQAEALISAIKRVPGLEAVPIAYYSSVEGSSPGEAAIAASLLFLGQPDDPEHPFPRNVLPADCKQITFAPLGFNLYWPWTTPDPSARGAFPYGDRVISDCVAKGMAPRDILAYYKSEAWSDYAPDFGRLLQTEAQRLRTLDARCDVKPAELVLANFAGNRLFLAPDRPAKLLFSELIGRILTLAANDFPPFAKLNVPAFLAAASSDGPGTIEVPVHPNVAEHLGLTWYDRNARYAWQGRSLSYDEYFLELIRHSIDSTLDAGAGQSSPTTPAPPRRAKELMWNDMSADERVFYYPTTVRSTFGSGSATNAVVTSFLTPPMLSLESAQIEITTWCNFACQQCGRTLLTAAGKWTNQHIELDRCRSIIDTLPLTGRLILQGVGEPTMHPHFVEIVRMAVDSKKFGNVTFNTNGQTHNDAWWRELARFPLLTVVLSIDSLDPIVASICRANTNVDVIWSQLQLFHSIFPSFVVSMVASRLNIDDFERTLRKMATVGPLQVAVQRMISDDESVVLRPEDEERVTTIIEAVRRDFPQLSAQMDGGIAPGQKRCVAPFVAPYISVAGYLTPCCAAVDEAIYDHVQLDGTHTWDQIRSDARVNGWVRSFIEEDPEICRGCSFNPNQVTSSRSQSVSRSF